MNKRQAVPPAISDSLISTICERLAEDQRVRRTLPGEGRISIDRRLPFLCVYRRPSDRADAGTQQLVDGEAAFLVAPDDPPLSKHVSRLVRGIVRTAVERFGGFLVLEIWSAPDAQSGRAIHPESGEPLAVKPGFQIREGSDPPDVAIQRLTTSLRRLTVRKQVAEVKVDPWSETHPPNMKPLLSPAEAKRIGCHIVGLEVWPVYRDPETGEVFPSTLRLLRRKLGRALKRTFFDFAHAHTNIRPQHYYALGGRTLPKLVWEVDRRLAEIADSFDFLLQATPFNVEAAWQEFKRSRFETPPVFHYRPLAMEPALLKRQLYEIPIEQIDDPTLAHLFRQKQDELDRKITMLADVGTSRFLPGSLQVYGRIEPPLLKLADELLRTISAHSRDDSNGRPLDARAFAERALAEIEIYRGHWPDFAANVVVRDDMYSGLLVSNGDLLIGRKTTIPAGRVEALLEHEIGTHSVTYFNGRSQPLQLLHAGLAGYDGLQEGLAVLAEYLVGGLSRPRLRLLAARVAAIHQLVEGSSFVETFRRLDKNYEFGRRTAYTITMRVYRGGGLTKDAVYLRGLVEILDYLRDGGELEPLFVGKIAVDHSPIVQELLHRRVLRPPPLRPRYFDNPQVADKLARLARGLTVMELMEGKNR